MKNTMLETTQVQHVLIVDDNPQNLQILGKLLKEKDYEIEFATNGKSAIEWLDHKKFDIILLDINMPETNGFEVCKMIRTNDKLNTLPIIFLTADTDRESILKGFELGAQDYITKPFDSRELLVRIKTHLSLKLSIERLEELNQTLEQKVNERTLELTLAKEKAEESDRLKTAFLQNLSHEVRTPMNGILGFAQLLKDRISSPETIMSYIDVIVKSGHRMMSLIHDLVDIAKIESGQISVHQQAFSINDVLDELCMSFSSEATGKGLSLSITKKLSAHNIVSADREIISRAMSNLIKNAIKFTKEGAVGIGCEYKNDEYEFFVSDTGIGVVPEKQKVIFENFIQADTSISSGYEGAGLGLPISKAYVEAMGGTIMLESVPGEGSTFKFTMPQDPKSNARIKQKETPPTIEYVKEGLLVLIVEDDPASRMLLSEYLIDLKANIQFATNGQEAVEKVTKNLMFDVILMDLKMPVMNGYEATKLIRELGFSNPIIAQTAYASNEDIENTRKKGFNELISKPINKRSLIDLIKRYTHREN